MNNNPYPPNSYDPYNTPPPYPPQGPTVLSRKTQVLLSILSYFGILWVVGLLAGKQDRFVRYHVNQGIIFFLFIIFTSLVKRILYVVLGFLSHIAIIGGIVSGISGILGILIFIIQITYFIIGICNASHGKAEPLPFIGNLFTILK